MFEQIKKTMVPLVEAISEKKNAVRDDLLHQQFDEVKLSKLEDR